jgi:predicted Zn-dependent protease
MTNLVLQNGSQHPEQLIGSVLSGLFVKMIANGRVYPAENRFSFDVVEGYRIANGRLERPVTGLRIHGRSSEILHRLEGIADDLLFDSGRGVCLKKGQRVDVAVGTPTVLISRLRAVPIPM